jgi:CheY-like chemotaxis protein
MVDPPQLDSAILNICINARDAMPDGGRLIIDCRNADPATLPDVARDIRTDLVALSITDTGTGMDEDTLARAFEPFFTTKDVGKGSGLGLSMVYGFVRQSGGAVELRSAPGQGTTVTLYLPRAADEAEVQAPAPDTAAAFPGGHEHILAVEDNDLVRENLVGQLTSLGYRVTTAADGAEALALLPGLPDITLLLTDVVMPGGINGWELARRVLAQRPGLKVMFASGFPVDVIEREGARIGPSQLLEKPYRRQELATKLRQVLDGRPD